MCGIVGAVAERNVSGILLEGLKRLEYRGYDSAGMALLSGADNEISTVKAVGKVNELVRAATKEKAKGHLGIAHTRWATHGKSHFGKNLKPTATSLKPRQIPKQ